MQVFDWLLACLASRIACNVRKRQLRDALSGGSRWHLCSLGYYHKAAAAATCCCCNYLLLLCVQIGALDSHEEQAGADRLLTGLEFDELAPLEKTDAVAMMSVFARVEPSHKSRLVELLQAQVQLTYDWCRTHTAPPIAAQRLGTA